MNSNKPKDLKGKRKKILPKNANPLFTQWLTEWKDEAAEKGWKSHHTYSKALKTLKLFPLRLETGKDCKLLQNFGDKICKMLDEKLAEYKQIHGTDDNPQEKVVLKDNQKNAVVVPQKGASTSNTHVISDNSESDCDKCPSPQKKKRQVSQRKAKEYVPGYRSGPYALILTLYRYMQDPDFKGFMTKSELSHEAQTLSEKSFTKPDPGSHYTAWSSMSSLIKRGLVQKDGCPARFVLTDSGYELGIKLDNAEKGITVEQVQSIPQSNNPTNGSHDLPIRSSSFQPEETHHVISTSRTGNCDYLGSHIVLSDSEEELMKEEILCNGNEIHMSSTQTVENDNDICILSDGEDELAMSLNEQNSFTAKHTRLHSLSPSSSSSSPSSPPASRNNPIILKSDSLPVKNNKPVGNSNEAIIEIGFDDNDDYDCDNHITNFESKSGPSKFSWEVAEKQKQFLEYDDDELPDLDEYVPLSKRLMNKGITSSLLNTCVTNSCTGTYSLDDHSRKENQPRLNAGAKINICGESRESPDVFSYTNIQEKNTKNDKSSLKTDSVSNVDTKQLSRNTQKPCQLSSAPSLPATSELTNFPPITTFTLQPGTFDIILCIDQREFYGSKSNSKTLLPDLMKSGVNCDLRHLHISDLLWIARERTYTVNSMESSTRRELVLNYAVERKRMDDLVSSISSGRLKEQKFRLKHSGISELIILIEEYGSIQNFSISEDRIKQTIINSQVIDGFKVKRCGSSKEAVTYLALMTRFLQSHFHSKTLHAVSHDWLRDNKKSSLHDSEHYLMPFDVFNEASVKQKILSVKEMFAKQLLQIPGISLDRANAITKVYPTLSKLVEAYENCESEKSKESLLASIKCGNKERNLGIAISRLVKMMYNATGALS